MTTVVSQSDTGISFDEAAAEVRVTLLASLESTVERLAEKVAKSKEDAANAEAALDAAKAELYRETSAEGVAAYEAVVAAGVAFENRSPEEKAADAVASAEEALKEALAAQASIKEA